MMTAIANLAGLGRRCVAIFNTRPAKAPDAVLGRREWRRLEQAAQREHERELLASLRALAAGSAAVSAIRLGPAPGVVTQLLPGHRLSLAGVAPAASGPLRTASADGQAVILTGAGRYGPYWWLTFRAQPRQHVLLASYLRLAPDEGHSPAPASPGPPARQRTAADGR